MPEAEPAGIYILAGVNGAGKSSLLGAYLAASDLEWFDPDEAARRIRTRAGGSPAEANGAAWQEGRRLLERAIADRLTFALETTLGGNTIAALLEKALDGGFAVRIWYVGLNGLDLHLARIRARVARGGHDIPEDAIRRRYDRSRENLIRLLPRLSDLWVYDNSFEADPARGSEPKPRLLLHWQTGRIKSIGPLGDVPTWAKPIVQAALRAR